MMIIIIGPSPSLSCAVLCQIVSLQYLSRSSLHRLAGLPCRLFLSYYGLQVVTRDVHRSYRRLICPAQDHLIFLTLLSIWIYDLPVCSLPDSDVGLSIFVCDVEHTSFHFGLCSIMLIRTIIIHVCNYPHFHQKVSISGWKRACMSCIEPSLHNNENSLTVSESSLLEMSLVKKLSVWPRAFPVWQLAFAA